MLEWNLTVLTSSVRLSPAQVLLDRKAAKTDDDSRALTRTEKTENGEKAILWLGLADSHAILQARYKNGEVLPCFFPKQSL